MAEEEVTEEQAEVALQQLLRPEESETAQPVPEPTPTEETVGAAEARAESAEPAAEATEEPAEEVDDVVLLKQRNEELEAQNKAIEDRYDSRLKALQNRTAASEKILRDRYLRKSTAADRAREVLQASRTEAGAAEADVERVIQELDGTMHPSSASYAAPESQMGPTMALTEDRALVLNGFLNEKGMTLEESDKFGKWIRSEARSQMTEAEQAVAGQSLDGFLRLAHSRWQEGSREKEKKAQTDDAVEAVKSVQRTQRQAAKAASLSTTSPKKQPGAPKSSDVSELTPDEVSKLVRQSYEQYQ